MKRHQLTFQQKLGGQGASQVSSVQEGPYGEGCVASSSRAGALHLRGEGAEGAPAANTQVLPVTLAAELGMDRRRVAKVEMWGSGWGSWG